MSEIKNDRAIILSGFIKLLERKGIFKFNIDDFNSRVRLQKYVYLAKKHGFDVDYNFNMYIHGPYSPDLAKEYFYLSKNRIPSVEPMLKPHFFNLIKDKDVKWLELASTYELMKKRNSDLSHSEIVNLVAIAKNVTRKKVEQIVPELE